MSLPYEWHGAGEPLVLIAGLGAKGTSWQPFLERACHHFRVLTFDNRGTGRAPPLGGSPDIAVMAEDVLALLDHLGVEHARVVGRSMGGMIAQELALRAPERVERLGLVSTSGRVKAHLAEIFLLWARMAESGVPAELRHRSSMLWCLGRDSLRSPESGPRVRAYLRAKSNTDRPVDYALQARACARHDALERLGSLSMPTLVLSGTDDLLTPTDDAEELAKAIPGASLRYIPGSGHLAYLESPDRFAAELLDFLTEEAAPCPIASTMS